MLNLPRLTFLIGPENKAKADLTAAIAADNPDTLILNLFAPIDNMLRAAFPFSFPESYPEGEQPKGIPVPAAAPQELIQALENLLGSGPLGQMLCNELIASGDLDIYDNFLFPDCTSNIDLKPFETTFKPKEMLFIYTTMVYYMSPPFLGANCIILAHTDNTVEQMNQLRNALSYMQTPEPADAKDSEVGSPS